ncbi:hypothetical protein ATANTOWER_013217 [Ataeniobius toweri]|uniref:Uncharacterized protein n=1 Tax=Ataeniobius toweri TaxID=208326 RepID=A0ABU7BTS4_9TELE|nr:hypothetical protein [Ataeniobius toweri]
MLKQSAEEVGDSSQHVAQQRFYTAHNHFIQCQVEHKILCFFMLDMSVSTCNLYCLQDGSEWLVCFYVLLPDVSAVPEHVTTETRIHLTRRHLSVHVLFSFSLMYPFDRSLSSSHHLFFCFSLL